MSKHFDAIFCINLDTRKDRWESCERQFKKYDYKNVYRMPGYPLGVQGCFLAHLNVLAVIAFNQWPSTLILEDDFKILHDDFNDRLDVALSYVPADWDLIYLGCHYQQPPLAKINEHVLRIGHAQSTVSYMVTGAYARVLFAQLNPSGAIDEGLSTLAPNHNHYAISPRLIVQGESFSDLTKTVVDYTSLGTEPRLERYWDHHPKPL